MIGKVRDRELTFSESSKVGFSPAVRTPWPCIRRAHRAQRVLEEQSNDSGKCWIIADSAMTVPRRKVLSPANGCS